MNRPPAQFAVIVLLLLGLSAALPAEKKSKAGKQDSLEQ